jgi:diguanylate cyclase (GGDEF)-like protein/PAS domain S-box-containing protein
LVRALVRGSNAMVFLIDREGRFLGWHGVGVPFVEGRTMTDALLPEQAALATTALEQAFVTGAGVAYDVQHVISGVAHIFECRMEPISDRQLVAVVRDVTDRVERDRKYLKNAARFEAIIHNSSELVVVTDATGAITFVSPEPAQRIGYDADELIGRSAFDLLHPDEAADALEALGGSLAGPGVKDTAEVRVRTADGAWRMFEVVPTNMLDDPDVAGFVFHLRDLTERYEQQRAFRLMFEHSPVPQIQVYPDVVGIHANHAFARLVGYSREELLLRTVDDLTHPDDLARVRNDRGRLIAGDAHFSAIHRYVRKDGSTFFARVRGSSVRSDTGEPLYFYGAFEDVTSEMEAARALGASEARLRAIIDNSPDIIAVLDPSGHWETSRQAMHLLGYARGSEPEGGMRTLIHPDDVDSAARALEEMLSGARTPHEPIEVRLRAANGSYWAFECVGQHLAADVGGGVVITARNIEERKRAERAHREAEERFRTAFEHSPLCVSLVDLDGNILDINKAGAELMQSTREALIGTDARACVHEDDVEHAMESTLQQISGIDAVSEFRLLRPDGSTVWVTSHAALFTPDEDRLPYVITLQTDITERRNLEARLEREAQTDPLTGLYNRNAFVSHVELALARGAKASVGLLFVDLDRFKAVNDSCGHDVGDEVLIHVARAIERVTRGGDIVARLGGDEFVVLCHGVDVEIISSVGTRVVDAVCAPIAVGSHIIQVGASVGGALASAMDEVTALLRRADRAAYQAKRQGGSLIVLAEVSA